MIKISDLEISLSYDMDYLKKTAAEKLCVDLSRILDVAIVKRSVDLRDKQHIHFNMTIDVNVSGDENDIDALYTDKSVSEELRYVYVLPEPRHFNNRPVIVGFGPAGMFAALILAEAGARPIILERGKDVDSRKVSVKKFWQTGTLDPDSNVQFGEGGAGTFSDGKLKIGSKDFRKMKILYEFIEAGAPEEILYLSKPHIGTDLLSKIVKKIRMKVIALGGEIHFDSAMTDILKKDGRITGIGFRENGIYSEIETDNVILAIGHSARDTFERLLSGGILLEQKNFAVGVRIEHPQELIDKLVYGGFAGNPALGAADYKMVCHLNNGRNVFTFCMCPGGSVVSSSSEENCLVTNGMSEYKRDGRNANSALLVTLNKNDFGSEHPLAGVAFQRKIEKAAYLAGGGSSKAPVQKLDDFLSNKCSTEFGGVLPTYLPGTAFSRVDSYLPPDIAESLRQGIREMGEWMPGYALPDAVLTGAETRSTSPVRILRDSSLEAVGLKGLYPCGEGAGYAGGIISAALDGVLCAEQILKQNY